MQDWLLEHLRCPMTDTRLEIADTRERDGEHLLEGSLRSVENSSMTYPVTGGVPNLLAERNHENAELTLNVFGTEWQDFHDWGWIDDVPNEPDEALKLESGLTSDSAQSFSLKTGLAASGSTPAKLGGLVLDCGCGNGRFSREAAKSADRVIAIDASVAANVAFSNMRKHGIDNVGVVRGSVLKLPFARDTFDYVFSIGVLQHTGDASAMVSEMTRVVQRGCRLSLNCYGTGGFLYEAIDAAIRRRTTKMDQAGKLRFAHRMARFDRSMLLGGKLARKLEKRLRRIMVLRPTVIQMYDWYAPETAEHYTPEDLRGFFSDNGLHVIAATYPVTDPDYDDHPRKRVAGSYCFLLEKT